MFAAEFAVARLFGFYVFEGSKAEQKGQPMFA
jgi:hypothetical protein